MDERDCLVPRSSWKVHKSTFSARSRIKDYDDPYHTRDRKPHPPLIDQCPPQLCPWQQSEGVALAIWEMCSCSREERSLLAIAPRLGCREFYGGREGRGGDEFTFRNHQLHIFFLLKNMYLNILKSWSISESPGNRGLFVSCSIYRSHKYKVVYTHGSTSTISAKIHPMLHISTGVE